MRRQNEGNTMEDCRTSEGWNSFELRKINAIIFANITGRMFESLTRERLTPAVLFPGNQIKANA